MFMKEKKWRSTRDKKIVFTKGTMIRLKFTPGDKTLTFSLETHTSFQPQDALSLVKNTMRL